MKRFLLILMLLAVRGANAQTPPAFPTPAPLLINGACDVQGPWDAKIIRDGHELYFLGGSHSPADRGGAALAALKAAKPHDLILLNAVTFDFGPVAAGHVILPDQVTIRGMGRDQTILQSEIISDTLGCSFSLQNTVVEDLQLANKCWYFAEDGRSVGFDNGQFGVGPGPFTATIRHCKVWCTDWAVYNWSPNNTLHLKDVDITTGRVGVACENSGDGQNVTIDDVTVNGDASLSNSRGATSDQTSGGIFGIIVRGGPIKVSNYKFVAKGRPQADQDTNQSWTPRICGITDFGGAGSASGRAVLSVYDMRSEITPNGSNPEKCFDMDLQYDYVQKAARVNWANCWGSAADGSMSASWNH
jgi:hypothetical protein